MSNEPFSNEQGALPDPLPLSVDAEPSAGFPMDALGPVLGDAAEAIAESSQCTEAMVGVSLLAAAALAAQDLGDVEIDGRMHPCSLFCMTVAKSGDRKSVADKFALKPHYDWQRERTIAYNEQMIDYDCEMASYKAQKGLIISEKKLSMAGRMRKLKELGPPPPAPPKPRIIMTEPTLQAIHKSYHTGQRSQGLFSDEGGQFFGGYAMGKDNAQNTVTGVSKLWDGADIVRDRAGEGESFAIEGCRFSMHVMLQPVIAERVLSDPLMRGQGFLARFIVTWPDSNAGTRLYREIDATVAPSVLRYNRVITELLNIETPVDEYGRPQRDAVTLSPEAKQVYIERFNLIELQQGKTGKLYDISAIASKAAECMTRIAAVIARVENPHLQVISGECMERAARIASFHLKEAQRLNDVADADIELYKAKVLLDWFHNNDVKRISLSQIAKSGPRSVRASVRKIRAIMNTLEDHYLVFRLPEGVIFDGKATRESWEIRRV